MTKSKARGLAWGIAAAMTAVLFACAFAFFDVGYAENDDAAMLHAFQGYMNGEIATFLPFLHGLLVWPLHWLGSLAPTVAWYSYLQLTLLAVCCLVIAKSVMQIFVKHGGRLWTGAVMAAAVLCCFCLRYVVRITFTHTAALLGAAAVLQMMSIEHERPWQVIWGMCGSLALVVLSYSLRQEGVLAVLAVCALVFCCLFVQHYGLGRKLKRNAKPMLISLLIAALVMGGMVGWRELEITLGSQREYMEWQDVRSQLMDFYGELPQEAIDAAGWSTETYRMYDAWSFVDSSVNTESFYRALEAMDRLDERTAAEKLSDAWGLFHLVRKESPDDVRCMTLTAVVLALCLIGALTKRDQRGVLLAMVCALAALMAAMLLYLALRDRLPARAILMAVLPVAAALIGLLPQCLPKGRSAVAALVCMVYAVGCTAEIAPAILKDETREAELGNAMADLEEYALWEPDALFVYDMTLSGADLRLFPEYPDGVPDNITFWGGWLWGSKQSRDQWARYGVDLDQIDPKVFVEEEIYIASGRVDPPPERMLAWLRSKLGDDVQCDFWGENGTVYFFYFYQ